MEAATATGEGQVIIPQALRQHLGIRQGSRIEFSLVGDHVEMRVTPTLTAASVCSRANAPQFRLISIPPHWQEHDRS